MDADAVVAELSAAFGHAIDVTPAIGQPLHVLLPSVKLPVPWSPSSARVMLRFDGWPGQRPEFWIAREVVNRDGQPPRSNSEQLVCGEVWRQFSFAFAWPHERATATRAVLLWLTRFCEGT